MFKERVREREKSALFSEIKKKTSLIHIHCHSQRKDIFEKKWFKESIKFMKKSNKMRVVYVKEFLTKITIGLYML